MNFFFEMKYLRFIPNTMKIISLFHRLWFVRYKHLFSNTREWFKGPS